MYSELSLMCGCVRSLQRLFPIDNVLLRSVDIRDQVAKLYEVVRDFDVFGPPNFDILGNEAKHNYYVVLLSPLSPFQ